MAGLDSTSQLADIQVALNYYLPLKLLVIRRHIVVSWTLADGLVPPIVLNIATND